MVFFTALFLPAAAGLLAQSPAVTRFVMNLPATEQLVNDGLVLSPDGRTLVYVGKRAGVGQPNRRSSDQQLYRRSMDQLEASPIPGTEGGAAPFFSPDGQWVGFFTYDKLKKVALAGGPPVTLCDITGIRYGASWGSDDTIIFGVSVSGLLRVPSAGGTPQPLTTLDSNQREIVHRWPNILPGGQAVLFAVFSGSLETTRIAVQDLKTGRRKVLVDGTYPRFVPTGHIVFARTDRSLWAVPFDVDRLEVTGSPAPLIEGIRVNGGGLAHFALADNGSLVYMPVTAGVPRRLVWVDRKGSEQPLGAPARPYTSPSLSPDGRMLAVVAQGDIWVYDILRGRLSQLTFDGSIDGAIWSPDGKRIAFASAREGKPLNLFWKMADGSGPEERLTTGEREQFPKSWSPDGQAIAFSESPLALESSGRDGRDIWVLPLSGERKPRPFLRTPFIETGPQFSPDGRWLAYVSNESGRNEIYVQPFPGPGGKRQISTEGGTEPVWARNGELFYRNGNQMMAVETKTQPTFSAGTPRLLFEGPQRGGSVFDYTVAADAQRFLMVKATETGAAQDQIQVVLNWFEELKRLVPAIETGGQRPGLKP